MNQEMQPPLGRMSSPRPEKGAEDFWREFRTRASNHRQADRAWHSCVPGMPHIVTAMVMMALLLSAVGVMTFRRPPLPASNRINSLEVVASHGGVIIMEDESSAGTIVWIMDMENNDA